jgi:hypothetical protein
MRYIPEDRQSRFPAEISLKSNEILKNNKGGQGRPFHRLKRLLLVLFYFTKQLFSAYSSASLSRFLKSLD